MRADRTYCARERSFAYDLPVLKLLRYGLAAAMAAFALLQLNDPDPLVWIVAYGLVAFSVAAPGRVLATRSCWLTGGVLLALALGAVPGFVGWLLSGDPASIAGAMSPDQPHVEPAREFLGILIAAIVLVAFAPRRDRAKRSRHTEHPGEQD